MDYDAGFRGPLSGWINEILADPRTLSRGLWNMDGVMKLWDDFLHGRATMKRPAAKLGAVISLELWCRLFLDAEQPAMVQTQLVVDRASADYDKVNIIPVGVGEDVQNNFAV